MSHVKEVFKIAENASLFRLTTVGSNSDFRVANGTFLAHDETVALTKIFDYIQIRVPALDFKFSDPFNMIKYVAGGHYRHHFDSTPKNDNTKTFGNRIATFMGLFTTAEEGGATIFPNIGVTVAHSPGDAMLWFNLNPKYQSHQLSVHAGCPIYKGSKIGLTLWVRSKGQELRSPCPIGKSSSFDYLM